MCFLLKLLNMFSVVGTQCVFCCRYSMCFLLYVFCFRYSMCILLKVLNVFSVEGTQCVFCCRY